MSETDVFSTLVAQLPWGRDVYRHLHQHPELSGLEYETAELLERELRGIGVVPLRIGGTGVVGVLRNGEGPTVLARADTDGLPIAEATRLEYASTNGAMHACGHDMHMASLLGSLKALADNVHVWSGTYIALFQPAEESASGAQAMLDDGLTTRIPKPDVALAQHVLPFEAGTIATTDGTLMSEAISVRVTVHGRGGHGSMPHRVVDPVVLAASIVVRLQTIVAREVEAGTFAVLTVGAINSGTKSNIVPDSAELLLNLRAFDHATLEQLIAAIRRIVAGECRAAGSPMEPDFEFYDHFPLTSNHAGANERVTRAFVRHFGGLNVRNTSPLAVSEDFSRIPDAFDVPYVYWCVGSIAPEVYLDAKENGSIQSDIPANHSSLFAPLVDPTLEVMTRAQVVAALEYLAVP